MSKVTKAEINLITDSKTKIVGIGRIILNNDIVIDGVKVIRGKEGLFVGMPSRKSQEGTWSDVAYATNKELKQAIQEAVLADYNSKLGGSQVTANVTEDDDEPLPF